MAVLHLGFTLATIFLFLNVLFANDAWAPVPTLKAESTFLSAATSPSEVFLHNFSQGHTLTKRDPKYTFEYCNASGNRMLCATTMSDTQATTFLGQGSVVAQYTTTDQLINDGWQHGEIYSELQNDIDKYLAPLTLSSFEFSLEESEAVSWMYNMGVCIFPSLFLLLVFLVPSRYLP
jgi:hypothetical protein